MKVHCQTLLLTTQGSMNKNKFRRRNMEVTVVCHVFFTKIFHSNLLQISLQLENYTSPTEKKLGVKNLCKLLSEILKIMRCNINKIIKRHWKKDYMRGCNLKYSPFDQIFTFLMHKNMLAYYSTILYPKIPAD